MEHVSPEHPLIPLLFAVEGEPTDEHAIAVEAIAEELWAARSWTVGPNFVNEYDDASTADPSDAPIRTVGLFLEIPTALPPWGDRLPVSVERAVYDDVTALLDRMVQFSHAMNEDVVVELDGETIGYIARGAPDSNLTEGLLGEWRRTLESREQAG